MGLLINGRWSTDWDTSDQQGRFVRPETQFRNWVTADGASGFTAESDRYHLYVSYACPWAHRTLIMRKLKGLEDAISLSVVDPYMDNEGWHFSDGPGCIPDSANGAHYLRDIYMKAQPHYSGRVTFPVLWDKQTATIVNNESREIMRMFDTAFGNCSTNVVDYCPHELEGDIDKTIDALFNPINNGVYRASFATTQEAYDEAVRELFEALNRWEDKLVTQPYLCGEVITEADWCFFTTLVRFDIVYVTHFKCNLRRIVDYPNIWNYLKDLYQIPGIAETCNFGHIKHHYFQSHPSVNPTRIVPIGPAVDFNQPHDRDRFFRESSFVNHES